MEPLTTKEAVVSDALHYYFYGFARGGAFGGLIRCWRHLGFIQFTGGLFSSQFKWWRIQFNGGLVGVTQFNGGFHLIHAPSGD